MSTLTEIPVPAAFAPLMVRVFVGGCGPDGGRRFRRWAHAHCRKSDPHFGTVCFLGRSRIYRGGAKVFDDPSAEKVPSRTFWHEYAHLLAPGAGHGPRWQAAMRDLGQPVEAHYKRKRHRHRYTERGRACDGGQWRSCPKPCGAAMWRRDWP